MSKVSSYASSTVASERYESHCAYFGDLFNTSVWQRVVESLGATVRYHWCDEHSDGFASSTFKKGPFSIAYVGFPDGRRTISRAISDEKVLAEIVDSCLVLGVSAIRISGLRNTNFEADRYHTDEVTESDIENLATWEVGDLSSSVRRNIKKSIKSGVIVKNDVNVGNAGRMHSLYLDTVARHQGKARYTQEYFQALLNSATKQQSPLRVYSAYLEEELIAYAVTAIHQTRCVYLHGAQSFSHQNMRAMDAVFEKMITAAKLSGSEKFSFQASPKHQSGLIRYKEKWGAVSQSRSTVTVYGTGVSAMILRLVLNMGRR